MSADSTKALIHRYFDAFNGRDIAGMIACLHEDVAHDINQGGREIGTDAFEQFLIHMNQRYRERLEDILVFVADNGIRAAAEFTVHGTYLATDGDFPPANGQQYSLPAGAFFEVDDDRITRVTLYYNVKDWAAQVS